MNDSTVGRNFAAEFVATTIVMLGGPGLMVLGGDDVGTLEIAVGFGASVALAIGVIGALANPMFSLALLFARAITLKEAAVDWAGQIVGAGIDRADSSGRAGGETGDHVVPVDLEVLGDLVDRR